MESEQQAGGGPQPQHAQRATPTLRRMSMLKVPYTSSPPSLAM